MPAVRGLPLLADVPDRERRIGRSCRLPIAAAVDYTETEPSLPATGVIALQIHGNAVSEVCFKDIESEELP
jgi:hypothetical protein